MYKAIFYPFSSFWLIFNFCFLLLGLGLVVSALYLSEKKRTTFATMLGYIQIIDMLLIQLYMLYAADWHYLVSMPLQYCSILQMISAYALIKRTQFSFEIVMLYGVLPPIQAFVYPSFGFGTEGYYVINYFLSHALTILSPFYLLIAFNMWPSKRAWLKGAKILVPFFIGIFCLNLVIGSNYAFLRAQPAIEHVLIVGTWPYYVPLWFAIVIFFAYLSNKALSSLSFSTVEEE